MKKAKKENQGVNEDEAFLEGINLVTGIKIDYNRHLQNEAEINSLCINQKMHRIDKFILLMEQGEKIQKWSILQNLTLYFQTTQSAQKGFSILENNFQDYQQLLAIMADGICKFLSLFSNQNQKNSNLALKYTEKIDQILYRLIFRTISTQKFHLNGIADEWILVMKAYFECPKRSQLTKGKNSLFDEIRAYVNSSFSMNTLPERRKVAFSAMGVLVDQSQEIHKQAQSKVLFFNNDLNPATRLIICSIIKKLLLKKNDNPELWKCVQEYFCHDKSRIVKEKSLQIMASIYHPSNFQLIFNELDEQNMADIEIILNNLSIALKTFAGTIQNNEKIKIRIISFINRLIRLNTEGYLQRAFEYFSVLSNEIIHQTALVANMEIKVIDVEKPKMINHLILFYQQISHIEFKENVKNMILKGLKNVDYDLKVSPQIMKTLMSILDLKGEQDISYALNLYSKMVDSNQWKSLESTLPKIKEIKLFQANYEKLTSILVRLLSNCPYFLTDAVIKEITYLMLADRKCLELFLIIKEKFMNSRCWTYRRNYLFLYCYIKSNTSFEFNKIIPPLIYKILLSEKNSMIKYQFLRIIIPTYKSIDPAQIQQKSSIREVITKFTEEKESDLQMLARSVLQEIKKFDSDIQNIHRIYEKNKEKFISQQQIEQVQIDSKKHIKTEKLIKEVKKKGPIMEARTSLNLSKEVKSKATLQRPASNKPKLGMVGNSEPLKPIVRCNSTQSKQIKLPNIAKGKPNRFD